MNVFDLVIKNDLTQLYYLLFIIYYLLNYFIINKIY